MSEEIVLEEFVGRGSAPNIDAETDRQESLQLLAELLWLLETRCTISSNQVQCLQWFLVEVGWLRLDHFDGHDTQRPNVDLGAILLLLDDFRSHPVRCTDHSGALGLGFSELGTETKIS
jgi:hypothetical protein